MAAEVVALLGLAGLAWTVRSTATRTRSTKKPVADAQSAAEVAVNGWEKSSKQLRTLALLIVVGALALSVLISVFTPLKLFPKQPSIADTNRALLAKALTRYSSGAAAAAASPRG